MIATIITKLLGFASTQVLDRVLKHFEVKAESQVERERIAAGIAVEQIKAVMAEREASRDIRLATVGFWEMRLITAVIAGCMAVHLLLVTVDTITTNTIFEVAGWDVPALPKPFDEWQGAILLSFFGIYTVGKGVTTVAGALISRGRSK